MNSLCSYGCGKEALYFLKNGKRCCSKKPNSCPILKELNSQKLKEAYKNGVRQRDAFKEKGRQISIDSKKAKVVNDLQNGSGRYRGNNYIKKILTEFNLLELKCSECKITNWNNKPITLEIDHIDGDAANCKLENLRYLCPNCHSQTSTFRGKNLNTGKIKVSDEVLIEAIKTSSSVRQALIKAGLSPRGGNYARAYKLSNKI
jgi:5-methylcytosine-specific restriction endonuclease McrA